jgi:hypothetical protein
MANGEMFELFDQLYAQAKMQFGSAIKGRWFYDRDGCPGCGSKIKGMKWKGRKAVSLNAFLYREHGVLIAYLLCGKCAKYIFKSSEVDPINPTALHREIEENLKSAFVKHLGH